MNSSVQSVLILNNCAFVELFIWTELDPSSKKSLFSDRMERPHDIAQQINDLLIRAADSISEFNPDFDPQIRTADERFGDFQANGILPFAKKNNLNPRQLGEKLIASLPPSEDWEISLAGPGFINFKLSKEFLAQWLKTFSNKAEIKKAMTAREPSKITLDFSSEYRKANACRTHPIHDYRGKPGPFDEISRARGYQGQPFG